VVWLYLNDEKKRDSLKRLLSKRKQFAVVPN